MSQLDRLEAFAQRLVEGTFRRIFQPQPDEVRIDTRELSRVVANNRRAKQWSLHIDDRRLVLGEPVLNMGRALENDIILSDPTVSRYHAQLRWRNGKYYLYQPDPAFKNASELETSQRQQMPHTLLNDQMVAESPQPLAHADTIRLGQTALRIVVTAEM